MTAAGQNFSFKPLTEGGFEVVRRYSWVWCRTTFAPRDRSVWFCALRWVFSGRSKRKHLRQWNIISIDPSGRSILRPHELGKFIQPRLIPDPDKLCLYRFLRDRASVARGKVPLQ